DLERREREGVAAVAGQDQEGTALFRQDRIIGGEAAGADRFRVLLLHRLPAGLERPGRLATVGGERGGGTGPGDGHVEREVHGGALAVTVIRRAHLDSAAQAAGV